MFPTRKTKEGDMDRFEAFKDMDDRWRWRLMVGNDRVIASSKAGFDSQADALRAAEIVKAGAAGAQITEDPGLGPKEFIAELIRAEEVRRLDVAEERPRPRHSGRARERGAALAPRRELIGSRRPA
jgi:uncharacterized protein YegP (UPF0339 family)